jgi:hypothetical protein
MQLIASIHARRFLKYAPSSVRNKYPDGELTSAQIESIRNDMLTYQEANVYAGVDFVAELINSEMGHGGCATTSEGSLRERVVKSYNQGDGWRRDPNGKVGNYKVSKLKAATDLANNVEGAVPNYKNAATPKSITISQPQSSEDGTNVAITKVTSENIMMAASGTDSDKIRLSKYISDIQKGKAPGVQYIRNTSGNIGSTFRVGDIVMAATVTPGSSDSTEALKITGINMTTISFISSDMKNQVGSFINDSSVVKIEYRSGMLKTGTITGVITFN